VAGLQMPSRWCWIVQEARQHSAPRRALLLLLWLARILRSHCAHTLGLHGRKCNTLGSTERAQRPVATTGARGLADGGCSGQDGGRPDRGKLQPGAGQADMSSSCGSVSGPCQAGQLCCCCGLDQSSVRWTKTPLGN